MIKIQQFVETLIKDKYNVLELSHAFRINGFLDLYKGGKCVYNKLTNEYKKFTSEDNAMLFVRESITGSTAVPDFKKAKHGITYQEFRHAKYMNDDSSHAEDYHWRLDKDLTGTDMYIIFHRDTAKIGKTKDIEKRIKQLQTGLSHSIEVYLFKGKGHMERKMHEIFSCFKTNREWFKADYRIFRFAKKYGTICG